MVFKEGIIDLPNDFGFLNSMALKIILLWIMGKSKKPVLAGEIRTDLLFSIRTSSKCQFERLVNLWHKQLAKREAIIKFDTVGISEVVDR